MIKKFIDDKKSVYLQADQTSEKSLLENMYIETSRQLNGYSQIFHTIDDYFEFLTTLQDERMIIVFDEFQYMVHAIQGITSVLQGWVDTRWNEGKLFFILCGSEIRMMEDLFAYHNPLYGRRTGQLKINPFEIPAIIDYFATLELEDVIKIFGVFGNIPAYLAHYNSKLSLFDNIAQSMLTEGNLLFEEPLFLLRQEFREISRYFSILHAVASGETRLTHISNSTGIEARTLPKYLSNLIAINLLVKEIPIGLKKTSSKYVHYNIDDQYLRFWFKFVNPNKNMLIKNGANLVIDQLTKQFDNYMGLSFEKFILELVILINIKNKLPDSYGDIGRWWKKGIEIDIVAISDNSILCIEVKYGKNIDGKSELKKLSKKIQSTLYQNHKVYTMIISQGFNSSRRNCITVQQLWNIYQSSSSLDLVI